MSKKKDLEGPQNPATNKPLQKKITITPRDQLDLDLPPDLLTNHWQNMSFSVTIDMKLVIDQAMKKAKHEAESNHQGHLLTLICADYLAS